jgi:hypothetical protein
MNCNNYNIGATGPIGVGLQGTIGATGATGPQGSRGPSQRGPPGPPGPSDKSFIIDHPINNTNYLVHVCLEGPEGGIYYKGIGQVTEGNSVAILLPDYCRNFGYEYTVYVSGIYDGVLRSYAASPVINNQFQVYTEVYMEVYTEVYTEVKGGKFQWLVIGKRCDVDSEINKGGKIKGQGPYTYS